MFNKNKVDGKVVIITGGSRGIGKATALLFAKYKAKVVIASRTEKELKQVEKEIKQYTDVLAIKADISKIKDIKDIVNKTIKKFKKIDFLINNAGIAIYKSLKNTTEKEIDDTININVTGLIHLSKEALPYLEKTNGIIVNVSSGAGKYGFPYLSVYCSSKFAVIGFTESLAREQNKVRVYALCPGSVNTKMYMSISPDTDPKSIDQPEDIAEKIFMLCTTNKYRSGSAVDVY